MSYLKLSPPTGLPGRPEPVEYQPDLKQITGEGGVVAAVAPGSIADALGLQAGDLLVAVGEQRLRDVIDYRFAIAEEQIELHVRTASGEQRVLLVEKDADDDLGLEFTEPLFDRLRTCNNKCPFCFLTQMPKGFRKTLYLKDDDYRLSFLYSNFVTFTNLSDDDWQRIERQRLSPMNISVHATDPFWRAVMLGKKEVPDVRQQIRRLGGMGIDVHSQIVACPGANDGEVLRQSVEDLIALSPTVQSIAVVPVGLTKYRFDGKRPSSIKAAIQVHESPDWIDTNWERQPLWEAGDKETRRQGDKETGDSSCLPSGAPCLLVSRSPGLPVFPIGAQRPMKKHTIVALVQDRPGVLSRVAGLVRRRGYNIESLAVGHSEQPGISRMTIVVESDYVEQVVKQLYRLIEVIKVSDVTEDPTVEREMVVIKLHAPSSIRHEIVSMCGVFETKIVDVGTSSMIIEMTGTPSKVENFIEVVRGYGIKEMMRTGRIAMVRGARGHNAEQYVESANGANGASVPALN